LSLLGQIAIAILLGRKPAGPERLVTFDQARWQAHGGSFWR
jgi:hypothetical protein